MKFTKSFLTALIGSIVGNVIVLFVFRPFVINTAMPLNALSVGPVIALTTTGIILATVVYAIMRAFMQNPNKAFIYLAVIVLIISFYPDYAIIGKTTGPFAGGTVGSALVLMLMHVVAAAVTIPALLSWGKKA